MRRRERHGTVQPCDTRVHSHVQWCSLTALALAWTLQRPGVSSVVMGPKSVAQLRGQLAALEVHLGDELLSAIDEVVPSGGVTVPCYLDDAFADSRPQPYHW